MSQNGGWGEEALQAEEDISRRMRVPKRIKANGDVGDEELHAPLANSYMYAREKFDMNVPDRIMLLGQDQHIGAKAPPREMVLENSVLGAYMPQPGEVRVATPPRSISLETHTFPSAAEPPPRPPLAPLPSPPDTRANLRHDMSLALNDSRLGYREVTPPIDGLTAAEEVVHLRRQVARINRRVMAIEVDALQRQQRERLAAALGLAYLLFKVVAWLNR